MSSARKVAANRTNGRKSHGPCTRAGKARSSRNALRHGLAGFSNQNPAVFEQSEQMAKAICRGDRNPLLFEQALTIAENELLLRCVRAERIAIIERLRDPMTTPLVKGDTRIAMAKIGIQQRDLAYNEFSQLKTKLINQGEEVYSFIQERICKPDEPTWKYEPLKDRDEYEAMHEAMPDLERLLRYERRALSRRKRAIREFVAIRARANFRAQGQ